MKLSYAQQAALENIRATGFPNRWNQRRKFPMRTVRALEAKGLVRQIDVPLDFGGETVMGLAWALTETEGKPITWKELYKAADKAGFATEVMACEENANDTILERAAEADQFDALAMGTLEERLACGMVSPAAAAFFEKMGVRF